MNSITSAKAKSEAKAQTMPQTKSETKAQTMPQTKSESKSKLNLKRVILPLLILALIITQTGCSNTTKPQEEENYFFDVPCKLTIYETKDGSRDAAEIFEDAWDLCNELEKTLSRTIDSSDVGRLNSAGGNWIELSDTTIEVLERSIYYGELSGGAFDVSIGGVSILWDFYDEDPELPDQSVLSEAVSHVDYRNIEIDGNMVRLLDPAAQIDLGGIAKGYIADRLTSYLESEGVTSGIINLGGNAVVIGSKPDGSDFVVGVEKPYSDRTELIGSIECSNKTVVTSGVFERNFEINGKIYHHVLSTTSGYPVETDLDCVTLIVDKGRSIDADALSTICLMLGSEAGKELIESQDGIEAVFCLSSGDIVTTDGANFNEEK